MIEDIIICEQISSLSDTDMDYIYNDVVINYPYPLALSFKNQNESKEPRVLISILIKDTLSTVLQYLALLGLWHYASSDIPRDRNVSLDAEQMLSQPGPGKWVRFLRTLNNYCSTNKINYDFSIEGMMDFLSTFISKGPKVIIIENGISKSQSIFETLVTLRNRWAHSKNWSESTVNLIAKMLRKIMYFLYRELRFICNTKLIATNKKQIISLIGATLPQEIYNSQPLEVELCFAESSIPIMRLIMHWKDKQNVDIVLLEEIIKEKKALYSSSFNSCCLSNNHPIYGEYIDEVINNMRRIRVENPVLSLENINFKKLFDRCNRYTENIIREFITYNKYNPQIYSPPENIVKLLNKFVEDDNHPVLVLSGEQGCGKSALIAHWASKLINPFKDGKAADDIESPAVILLECHNFPKMDGRLKTPERLLNSVCQEILNLEVNLPFETYLLKLEKIEPSLKPTLILILDALNEYEGGESERRQLLLDMPHYACSLKNAFNLGKIKMVLTLRWSLFEAEGFSERDYAIEGEFTPETFFGAQRQANQISITVPEFNINRAKEVYEDIRKADIGMRPLICWEELHSSMKKLCLNPMMMQLFMRTADGKSKKILGIRTAHHLFKHYLTSFFIVQKKDKREERRVKKERSILVLNILEAMRQKRTLHLPLEADVNLEKKGFIFRRKRNVMDEILKASNKRERLNKKGKTINSSYQDLIEQGFLREEAIKVMGEKSPQKRVSFNHELIFRFFYLYKSGLRKRTVKWIKWGVLLAFSIPYMFTQLKEIKSEGFGFFLYVCLFISFLMYFNFILPLYFCNKLYLFFEKIWIHFSKKTEILSNYIDYDCFKSLRRNWAGLFIISIIALFYIASFYKGKNGWIALLINYVLLLFFLGIKESHIYLERNARGLLRSKCWGFRSVARLLKPIPYISYLLVFGFWFYLMNITVTLLIGSDYEISKVISSKSEIFLISSACSIVSIYFVFFYIISIPIFVIGHWPLYLLKVRNLPLNKKWTSNPERFHKIFKIIFWVTVIVSHLIVIIIFKL